MAKLHCSFEVTRVRVAGRKDPRTEAEHLRLFTDWLQPLQSPELTVHMIFKRNTLLKASPFAAHTAVK